MIDEYLIWDPDYREFLKVDGIIFNPSILFEQLYNKPLAIDENNDIYYLDDIELIKYTGKKDRNGKKIYTGDYIRSATRKDIYEVEYDEDYATFRAKPINELGTSFMLYRCSEWINVGNKYEGLNESFKEECYYCNCKAEYEYNNKKLCKEDLIEELIRKGEINEENTTSYFDTSEGDYLGNDVTDLIYKNILEYFDDVKEIEDNNEE